MTHTLLPAFLPIFNLALRLAGYKAAELTGRPWAVTQRRLAMGMLVLGSATFSAVMLAVALSRIDPDSIWRWPSAVAGGLIYFVMVASFDSLFVSAIEPASRRSAAARIALSLIVTAFSAITLDSAIAGDRLRAEIESRRVQADLALAKQHAEVHDLGVRSKQAMSTQEVVNEIAKRLAADPPTPAFNQLLERSQRAEQQWQAVERSVLPQLRDIRLALTEARTDLAALQRDAEAGGTDAAAARLAALRTRRDTLERQVSDAQRALSSSRDAVEAARSQWQAEQQSAMVEARQRAAAAEQQLISARTAADKDAAASRAVNALAYKANLVEETAAFWSLAQRERAYMVIGIAVWLGAIALELLAIAMKLLMKPDELDEERQRAAEQRQLEYEALSEARAELLNDPVRSPMVAKIRNESLAQELAAAEMAKQQATETLLKSFTALQADRVSVNHDPSLLRSLDKQYVAMQIAVDEALLRFLKPRPDAEKPAEGEEPAATPLMPAFVDL